MSGELFYTDGRGGEQLPLSFANLSAPAIAEGIALLDGTVKRHLPRAERRIS
jgi:DNA-binding transcriptional MocR family regulator